ncbi:MULTISPECIES: hypothetical protein [unclassified Bradyrhizobium]|uniref:hypothetical protein n=1 Tax=unclassified Bradyrhizobium TaxID=2631580 RepID=UPI0015CC3A35|nr:MULTISPECIES: hypothetical protein [unclassified Bradyrhizobium]MBB4262265.1 hypothetical protein [Bradyrhizobium sp. CIR3A]NYG49832.1 hypothetical protein [Bradyrhizobium sp. IAR9]
MPMIATSAGRAVFLLSHLPFGIDEAAIRRISHHIVLSQCRPTQACILRRRSESFQFADRNKKSQGPHRKSDRKTGGVRGKQLCSAMELGRDD